MKGLIIVLMLIGLIICCEATLISEFNCKNENATLTFYNRLRDPNLQESGYTQGLKTGSINYLVNGSMKFSDNVTYYYGRTNDEGKLIDYENASVNHEQKVEFRGEKGISEFYGEGFFKNKRAISAWKKIRYDDFSGIRGPGLGQSYLSPNISVTASVDMNRRPGLKYNFNYHAIVDEGVLDFRDSTGWTNKSGSRKIDWEQTGLVKGKKLDITNNLADFDLRAPAAGSFDWLPCTCSGTIPPIEGLDSGWPSDGTKLTLQPMMLLPNNVTLDCSSGTCTELKKDDLRISNCSPGGFTKVVTKTSANCTTGNCPGFEGIFTYQAGPEQTYTSQDASSGADNVYGSKISVENWAVNSTSKGDIVTYRIRVYNAGKTSLSNIKLTDVLPQGMVINDWYEIGDDSKPIGPDKKSITSIETKDSSLTLDLVGLSKGQFKYIEIKARIDSGVLLRNKNIFLENQVRVYAEFKDAKVESSAIAILRLDKNGTAPSGEVID